MPERAMHTFRSVAAIAAGLALAVMPGGTGRPAAHEFWLEPVDFHPARSDRLVADGWVGQDLDGEKLGYFPESTVHFDLARGAESAAVTGQPGQVPAVDLPLAGDGLHVLRFQSANYQVTYPTLAKFEAFLEEWDQTWALQARADRDLPAENIREVYFRYAKALIDVGSGDGADPGFGMPLELVALTNPYAEPAAVAVELELRFKGAPLPGATVKVFRRGQQGGVEVRRMKTDASGRVSVPSNPGFHLVNAVHLAEASPRMQMFLGASWQSLWASITYDVE
jgi:cobalt/nickel transport protein